jgi:GNAT superfamily N-acetyltransferase
LITTAQSYHLKDLVRIGKRYFEASPYVSTHQFEENTLMDTLRRAMISPLYEVAVAEWDGKTVGGAVAYLSDYAWCSHTRVNMELIYVDEEYRAHGLVEGLIEHQLSWSRRNGAKEMIAGDIGFRPRVVENFYSQQGFQDPGVMLRKVL